jgi:hypothetical protein
MTVVRLAVLPLATLLSLGSCNSPRSQAEQAEKEFNLLKESGASSAELCQAHQRVAQAWLKTLDKSKYQLAKVEAELDCNRALLDRLSG